MQGPHLLTVIITSAILIFLSNIEVCAANDEFLPMSPGTCSEKCQKQHSKSETSDFHFDCSCSSSCVLYKDCCYDSLWRPKGTFTSSTSKTVCLFLAGKGRYEAIATCPRIWNGTTEFCDEGIGHLPPVTSTDSGVTYANVQCALCNLDGRHLMPWVVDLKCCPEHDNSEDDIRYYFSKNHLWSIQRNQKIGAKSSKRCMCQYVAKPGAMKFVNALELRRCGTKTEISTCSTWWTDKETADACKSYIDPIYLVDKVYRNMHCAQCNFENLADSRCRPAIVDEIFLAGAKYAEAREFCEALGLRACVHFLSNGRGRKYAFSEMFKTWEMQCVPPKGKRCCNGERYDFRHKMCRKLGNNDKTSD